VDECADQAKAPFAELKLHSIFRGEAVIGRFGDADRFDVPPAFRDEISNGLGIPRVEVMVRFGGVEVAVAAFFLEGNKQEELAAGFQETLQFGQDFRWGDDVFESVMADDAVGESIGEGRGVGDETNAELFQFRREKIGDVEADFLTALKCSQIPAGADAVFEDDIRRADVWLKFLGAAARYPRDRLRRNAPLPLVVLASFCSKIVLLPGGHASFESVRRDR
jgi:hypothetical protein